VKAIASVALALMALRGCGWEPNTEVEPPGEGPAAAAVAPRGAYAEERRRELARRQARRRDARRSLHEEELRWVSTAQHPRVALALSEETGFASWGLETAVVEIPEGWHTGRQRRGEEAVYVVAGRGFAAVDGVRYDFESGATLGIPYGASRQLFNTGVGPVRLVSATPYPLERFLGVDLLEQLEEHGPTEALAERPVSEDGRDARGRRVRLRWEDALWRDGTIGWRARLEAWLRGGVDLWAGPHPEEKPRAFGDDARIASRIGHHGAWVLLMGGVGERGFPLRLVRMSGFLIEEPGTRSGRHTHAEAVLYVVQGEGHSVLDGRPIPWRAGTTLHVPGPRTEHQHFNTGGAPAFLLRIASGLRSTVDASIEDVRPELWFEAHGPLADPAR